VPTRLQSLSQDDVLHLEEQAAKTPTPLPQQGAREQERRLTKLWAEMGAKKAR